jgi:hypothetical protein
MFKTFRFVMLAALAMGVHAGMAHAQDAAVTEAPAAAEDTSFDARQKLATELHNLRPTKPQVHEAIDRVSKMQPESEREAFVTAMRNILDYRAIEKISIDAMVSTYTQEELEAMVEYYNKPEAQSAMGKEQAYGQKVYPEIIKLLDQAMIKLRTGEEGKKAE